MDCPKIITKYIILKIKFWFHRHNFFSFCTRECQILISDKPTRCKTSWEKTKKQTKTWGNISVVRSSTSFQKSPFLLPALRVVYKPLFKPSWRSCRSSFDAPPQKKKTQLTFSYIQGVSCDVTIIFWGTAGEDTEVHCCIWQGELDTRCW